MPMRYSCGLWPPRSRRAAGCKPRWDPGGDRGSCGEKRPPVLAKQRGCASLTNVTEDANWFQTLGKPLVHTEPQDAQNARERSAMDDPMAHFRALPTPSTGPGKPRRGAGGSPQRQDMPSLWLNPRQAIRHRGRRCPGAALGSEFAGHDTLTVYWGRRADRAWPFALIAKAPQMRAIAQPERTAQFPSPAPA